jgi:hypothetical protein
VCVRSRCGTAASCPTSSRHERTSRGGAGLVLPFSDDEPLGDQPAPQSAEGEAKVNTLCGSTKSEAEFAEVNPRLTMEGCVVISLPDLPDYDWTADSSDLKARLGRVHFQRIRVADEVYIVDPGGYVGEPTRREIAYAESLGKPIRYLSRERLARTGNSRRNESDRAVRSSAVPDGSLVGGTCCIPPRSGRSERGLSCRDSPSCQDRATCRSPS